MLFNHVHTSHYELITLPISLDHFLDLALSAFVTTGNNDNLITLL
ncbi:hypothetical Protein YC6258_05550 [Gynuella sunshinyii YC6258]|uniref:Uncharacterized protein n=1 Tax=Gynuella sunshinyii YC6258 TaxID=1445510 RepID=A0A0C5W4N8_9GAMM|nr:hypothetical Protein YC6258_05550 [Gynuella sunshinyii YC6258]